MSTSLPLSGHPLIRACRSSIGRKLLMALSGSMLGGFLLVHALGNATIFAGRDMFNSYAEHLHALGPLVTLAEVALLTVFLIHIITGLSLFLENRKARPESYAVRKSAGGSTWGSTTMPWTGLVILGFIILHLANFHFVSHDRPIADIVAPALAGPLLAGLYGLAMCCLALHISHGFWSLFQTLGLNHPTYNGLLRGLAWGGCALISIIFLAIVVLLYFNPAFLG